MMFYGGVLKQPLFVTGTDTSAFGDLFHPATTTVRALGDRPYLNVALFLGPDAEPYAKGTRPLTELTPQMAWQHARFYPATSTEPAMMLEIPLHERRGRALPSTAPPSCGAVRCPRADSPCCGGWASRSAPRASDAPRVRANTSFVRGVLVCEGEVFS